MPDRCEPPVLIDRYRRHLNYLRISITDRCNLRCLYCVPSGPFPYLPHSEILTMEEILRFVSVGVRLGISKVRITGGEPLVRKGVCGLLGRLCATEGITDVSLTTNGVLLSRFLPGLQAAGIRRINVSLDTLDPARFSRITRRDRFQQVWEGILAAHHAGFHPIKINVVALNGINDGDLADLAKLAFDYPFHIRFIEYMPMGPARLPDRYMLSGSQILERIEHLGKLVPQPAGAHDGPAERYRFDGARGEIGLIFAMSRHFCNHCNRLRLTASGKLRTCLLSDDAIDVKKVLRGGGTDGQLADIYWEAARRKQRRHRMGASSSPSVQSQMSQIGG